MSGYTSSIFAVLGILKPSLYDGGILDTRIVMSVAEPATRVSIRTAGTWELRPKPSSCSGISESYSYEGLDQSSLSEFPTCQQRGALSKEDVRQSVDVIHILRHCGFCRGSFALDFSLL